MGQERMQRIRQLVWRGQREDTLAIRGPMLFGGWFLTKHMPQDWQPKRLRRATAGWCTSSRHSQSNQKQSQQHLVLALMLPIRLLVCCNDREGSSEKHSKDIAQAAERCPIAGMTAAAGCYALAS